MLVLVSCTTKNNQNSIFKDENLEYLDLRDNNISDISAVGNLEKLKEFEISMNQIRDISVLES